MTKKGAIIYGLFWAGMMILFSVFLEPISEGVSITPDKLWLKICGWIITGMCLGFGTRYLNNRNAMKKS